VNYFICTISQIIYFFSSLTITKTNTGKYYCSITCEVEPNTLATTNKSIGIDLGIKDYAILSNGTKYENYRNLIKSEKKLKFQQKLLSKIRNKQSCKYKQQKYKVTKLNSPQQKYVLNT